MPLPIKKFGNSQNAKSRIINKAMIMENFKEY